MGTRHHQKVISKNGDLKISQYGQWDGYPSNQGVDILKYLRNGDLDKYQESLENIVEADEEYLESVFSKENWEVDYPHLSRDCGAKIHNLVEKGFIEKVVFICESEAYEWCEGFYTIDFQNNYFKTEYKGVSVKYKLDNLPTVIEYLFENRW